MKVICSNLAMRFYVKDGWTQDILRPLLIKGDISIKHPDDFLPYFTLDVGSSIDIEKLLTIASEIVRTFDDHPAMSDREFLRQFNW